MIEIVVWLTTIVALNIVVRPLLRRLRPPGWAVSLRERPRRKVLLTLWSGLAIVMLLLWLIGETRGIPNGVMLLLWIGAPLTAIRLTAFLLRSPRTPPASPLPPG